MDNEQVPVPQDAKDIRFKAPTFIDPLTGLFNQYYLYQFLPEEMKKARLSNYPLTVFMIDLDGFKAVNDTYGHLCGDAVLKGLAVLLKKFVRQTDMVIRYAGDEFTILLPAADQARAEGLAKRLLEEIEKNIFKGKDNEEIRLTISLGLATYPEDAEEVDKLIDSADKALYLSKGRGKNRISQAKEVTLEAASYMIAMDSFPCVKFIDRQAEIEKLKQIFDNAVVQSNQLQLAFISGEAGMGKSRLLAEVSNYAQDRAALINCRCSSTHTQDPYYLFAKGISNYIDKVGIDAPLVQAIFSKIPAAELGGLSRLVPAIGYIVKKPGDDLEKNDRNARFLLFKAFLDFLIELNNISAVLIAFDDIQWADKASLELLRYLTQQERNKRMLILCSFTEDKSKEMTSNANLKKLWEDIHFDTNFTHIKIKNFPLADASLMIESIFPGISAEKDFYELIYNATGGNPSFIEEMLKSLVENAVIFYQDNHWQIKKDLSRQDVPFSIEEVIKKRLKNLDEETKEAILQAAVIGEDFSLDILKKIDNKDEGMMLELLNRAKKMRLLNELEHKGDFGFVNKHVQNLLYNELNEEQRRLLHYKIGESIAKEHKDNPYNVAGEVVYHLAQAPDKDKAMEYTTQFSQKITQMFDPAEALEYLDELTKEVLIEAGEEKGPAAVLNEQMLREVMKFIRIVQGAVKTFQLYPPGVMRNNIIKEAYTVINTLCQSVESIDLSEVEKGLVINDKRISPREIEQANIDKFLAMMMEYNLKTVSFVKGVTVDDLSKFIECISRPYPQIRDKGGWPQITKQGNIRGIKTEELNAGQQASAKGAGAKEFAGKKKLQNVMLMEFLLGKIEQGASIDGKAILQNMHSEPQKFAQTIAEAADAAVKQGQAEGQINAVASSIEKINIQIDKQEPLHKIDYLKDLARVILELQPALRNKVVRSQILDPEAANKDMTNSIIKAAPDEMLIDTVIEEHSDSGGNPLAVKDFTDKILFDELRKKEVLPKLKTELSKLNIDEEDIAFVTGEVSWEELSLDKRVNYLLKLPDKYYSSETEKINKLLEELALKQDKERIEQLLYHLMIKSRHLAPQAGSHLLKITKDFIRASFFDDKIDIQQAQNRLAGLLKKLTLETDPDIFSFALDIFKEIIKELTLSLELAKDIALEMEKPAGRKCSFLIHQLLYIFAQKMAQQQARSAQFSAISSDFIKDISQPKFLEMLVYDMIGSSSQRKVGFKDIYSILGEQLVDILINLESQKTVTRGDSFREYIVRKGIVDLFRELGEPALNRLRQKFSQAKEDVSAPLIELVGYLKKEELVDLLLPFVRHREPFLRRATIIALADIGTEKSINIISAALKEERDKNIIILVKEQLKKLKKG